MTPLTVLAPLRLEARAVRAGAPWARVRRVGMGPRRAPASLRRVPVEGPALIAGVCGGLSPGLKAGDVVLADELRGPDGTIACADPTILAGVLRRGGLAVHTGPIVSSPRIITGARRRGLAASGALAVDMESAFLAPSLGTPPLTVLRIVLDTEGSEPYQLLRTAAATWTALRSLRRAAALLEPWARALAPRTLVLATPRASDGQDGFKALTLECEAIVVVGSSNSSNSRRLVEVAERTGRSAVLVEDAGELRPEHVAGARRIGITAGASAPEELVTGMARAIAGLGGAVLREHSVAREEMSFRLPLGVQAPAEG